MRQGLTSTVHFVIAIKKT